MADEQDPFADLGADDPFTDLIPTADVRIMAYGPVVGEHHRAAMYGPQGNKLEPYDVAVSPNLGLELGDWIEVNGQARRVADWSYIKPGVPTKNTVEIRDAEDQGRGTINRVNLTAEEIQRRIGQSTQLIAGEQTKASEREASMPAEVTGDPFADLIPSESEQPEPGQDPFADIGPTPTPGIPEPKHSQLADVPPDVAGGLITPGNIDISNRPVVHNPDGSVSTELSFSIGTDKGEVLIPQVVNGKIISKDEAIQHYNDTGEHLGIFNTPDAANAYADALHNRGVPTTTPPPEASPAPMPTPHKEAQVSMPPLGFYKGGFGAGALEGPSELAKLQGIPQDQVLDHPLIPSEYMPPYLIAKGAEAILPDSTATRIYTGEMQGVADIMSSFTSPANVGLLATGGLLGKLATRLVATAFSAQAAAHMPEAWQRFNETDDPQEKTRLAVGTIAGIGLPLLAWAKRSPKIQKQIDTAIKQTVSEAPPQPVTAPPQSSTGFVEAFGTAKGAVSDSYIDHIWNKVQQGKPIERIAPLENQLREAQKSGALNTREDVAKIIRGYGTERPPPQIEPPAQFSVDMPLDAFGSEQTPVTFALMNDIGGVVSKSAASKYGRLKANTDLWDDAPRMSHPTHNKIYNPQGEMPDIAAAALYDRGLISEPTTQAMWNALNSESTSSRRMLKTQRGEAKAIASGLKEKATQTNEFIKAEHREHQQGAPAVPVRDLQVGDTVTIAGEKFKVTDIDPDTYDVTLEDGRKFGVQTVRDNTVIYGEHESISATEISGTKGEAPPSEPPPPTAPPSQPSLPGGDMPEVTLSELVNPVRGSGKFRRSYRIDKELGDRMEGIGAAKESGALRGELQSRNLLDELSPTREADLGRYLVSRRLKTVNPTHPQILPESEMRRIESDPAIAKALDYYKREIKPDIESWRKRAGLSEKAAAGKEPEFISLIPKTMDLLPQPGRAQSVRRLPRTTIYARAAQGLAKEYDTNLRNILAESYGEVIRKARVREFYAAAKAKGVTSTSRVFTPEGWKNVVQFEDLPPELAHDLTAATQREPGPIGAMRLGRAYQRLVTGVALTANPAELINHMRRQLNLVATKPPIGMGLTARLEALAPYFGPKLGAFKRAVVDNMNTPENQAILTDIFDAGGGSTRSFGHRYESNIPGIKWLQHKTTNLLFGIPRGRGLNGWDLRMRVQLEKIRRAAEGNTDPQRIREFANQIGQYGAHPDWFIKGLRTINPYAATTLPMRGTELRTAIGGSGLKSQSVAQASLRRGETILRGTGGTLLALSTANYLLSGKWPWENDKGHEFDLNTGLRNKDGKIVYVKLRAIAPELSRPVSTVSLPDVARETTAQHPQYLSAAMVGPLNQAASLVSGPGQNFALTALSGKVPYFLKRPGDAPELMDIARMKRGEHGSRGLRQLREAAKSVNPFGEIFGTQFEVDVPYGLDYIEEPIHGIKPFGRIFSTSYEHRGGSVAPPPPPPPPPPIRR